jgi:Kef-type K+ transport system membrane component KefB
MRAAGSGPPSGILLRFAQNDSMKRRLTRTIALHLTVTIAVIAVLAGVGAYVFFHVSPRNAFFFGAALLILGMAIMTITMRASLRRIRRNLGRARRWGARLRGR